MLYRVIIIYIFLIFSNQVFSQTTKKFDKIEKMDSTHYWVYKNGNKGLMDISGKIIIEPQYNDIKDFDSLYYKGYVEGQEVLISLPSKNNIV